MGFAVSLFTLSCQTINYMSEPLPQAINQLFSECTGDGGILIKAEQYGALIFVSEADWLAKNNEWTIEAYNGFGQTMGSINANLSRQQVVTRSMFFDKGKLTIGSEGKLLFDGHFTGLLADEIPCFLQQQLPQAWRQKVTGMELSGNQATLFIKDSSRDIELVVDGIKYAEANFCATIAWSQFFGLMSHEFEYCYLSSSDKSKMTFSNGVSIQWNPIQII